jgi:hypothetical protein
MALHMKLPLSLSRDVSYVTYDFTFIIVSCSVVVSSNKQEMCE